MDERSVAAGDLYSISRHGPGFRIVKVLKVEDGIVHVRLYANTFATRPTAVDPSSLELGTVHDESFGIGHMPISPRAFVEWRPEPIGRAAVHDDELDGYEQWREAAEQGEAGVWGAGRESLWVRALRRLLIR